MSMSLKFSIVGGTGLFSVFMAFTRFRAGDILAAIAWAVFGWFFLKLALQDLG